MTGRGRRNVSYVQSEEPAFLKRFKERVGYQDGPSVETKRTTMADIPNADSDDDQREGDEDKPTVVVLKPGDLTAEEAAKYTELDTDTSLKGDADDGRRIMFKKPLKRLASDDTTPGLATSSKKNKSEDKIMHVDKKHEHKRTLPSPAFDTKLNNSNLLSFDDEEGDCDD